MIPAARGVRRVTHLKQLALFAFRDLTSAPSELSPEQAQLHKSPRWYTRAEIEEVGSRGQYLIKLDQRPIRTPGLQPLVLPGRLLALAVAAEWQYQEPGKIRSHTMPLMSLAATAIDQPKPRAGVIEALLTYLETDTLCCRASSGQVADLQTKALDPILQQIQRYMQTAFVVNDSIFGCPQPEAVVSAVERYLNGLSPWQLTALDSASAACRSVLMGSAITQGWLGVDDALRLAQIEEQFQIDGWGLVEGGHDIDAAEIRVRIAAPSIFVRLLAAG